MQHTQPNAPSAILVLRALARYTRYGSVAAPAASLELLRTCTHEPTSSQRLDLQYCIQRSILFSKEDYGLSGRHSLRPDMRTYSHQMCDECHTLQQATCSARAPQLRLLSLRSRWPTRVRFSGLALSCFTRFPLALIGSQFGSHHRSRLLQHASMRGAVRAYP